MTSKRSRTIVAIGATGIIGQAVIELLHEDPDVSIRATTRQPHAFRTGGLSERVTPFGFDWDAPNSADDMVLGVDTMLVVPPSAHHPLPSTARLLDAAVHAGVRHVVFVSTLGADFEPSFTFGRWALTGEQAVAAAGVPFTVLRPNSFMTNFLSRLGPGGDGALRLPWGNGASSFVDPRDVAAVAARVLVDPRGHEGATYELTGPEALDGTALAANLSAAIGAPIRYVDTPVEIVRDALVDSGTPPAMVTAFLELHGVMASGARSRTTRDVQRTTGRPPRPFAEFAAQHATAWTRPQPKVAH